MNESTREQLRELKSRIPIADVVGEFVRLRKTGSSLMGLCPFHSERTPSFSVVPGKGIFHCFGCQKSGDAITFVQEMQAVSFAEAVRILASKYGVPLPRGLEAHRAGAGDAASRRPEDRFEVYYRLNHFVARFFHQRLLGAEGAAARDYLARRGVSDETIRRECLGFAPPEWSALHDFLVEKKAPLEKAEEVGLLRRRAPQAPDAPPKPEPPRADRSYYDLFRNRVMFPVLDMRGRVIAFGGRTLDDASGPKYLNSPESLVYRKGNHLYGMFHAQRDIRAEGLCAIVEGFMDCLSLQQAGVGNAVATLGTALTGKQIQAVRRLAGEIVLVFDGDEAGIQAQSRAMEAFLDEGFVVRGVTLPEAADPDEFVREKGVEAFRELMRSAPHLLDQRIEDLARRSGSETEAKARALDQILRWIAKLPTETSRLLRLKRVSALFAIEWELLEKRVGTPSGERVRPGMDGARVLQRSEMARTGSKDSNQLKKGKILDSCGLRFLEMTVSEPEHFRVRVSRKEALDACLEGVECPDLRSAIGMSWECAASGQALDSAAMDWSDAPEIRAAVARGLVTAAKEQGKEVGTEDTERRHLERDEFIREFNDLVLRLTRRGLERRRDGLRTSILKAEGSGQTGELARLMSEYHELVKTLERT